MLLGLGDIISSWFQKLMDFIVGFFAFIPMSIYFIYTSVCSLLDMFQALIRKLAGLDVYYINGVKQEGDMLVAFVRGVVGIEGGSEYSTLSTVFWSLIIFSVILLVLTTIISMIKAHYNYDAKKSNPMTIISNSIKALFTMVLVPIVTIFGLYLSQLVLQTLDHITSSSSGSNVSALFGNEANRLKNFGQTDSEGKPTSYPIYASYDAFGFGDPTSTVTFSGVMFNVAAYESNRVRRGSFQAESTAGDSRWENFGIFIDSGSDAEKVAMRIDSAFSNRLTLKDEYAGTADFLGSDSWVLSSAYLVGAGASWGLGCVYVKNFSKYNVGLVYYYYDLWTFNFFLGFAGIAACFTLFINIIFGLISRLLNCLALFLIYSPLVGIIPLDGGNGFKQWKRSFLENVLMAYGSVIGMNIFFLILPFLNSISFFNNVVLDRIMNALIIIAGLSLIKKFMKLLSGFIGAADANEMGKSVADDVKSTGLKAAGMTMGAAGIGVGVGLLGLKAGAGIAKGAAWVGRQATRPFNALNEKRKEQGEGNGKDGKAKKFFKKVGTGVGLAATGALGLVGGALQLGDKVGGAVTSVAKKAGGLGAGLIKKLTPKPKQTQRPVYETNADGSVKKDNNGNPIIKKDEAGNDVMEPVPETKSGLKAFGQGLLDIGGMTLKLAGDVMGISKLTKEIGESGTFDTAKQAVVKFGQKLNAFEVGDDGQAKIPKWLLTKKQSEGEKDKASDKDRETQEAIRENTSKTITEIQNLIRAMEKAEKK